MASTIHSIKCDPRPFQDVWGDRKKAALRYNDRNYQPGDLINLRETLYSAAQRGDSAAEYTGREIDVWITHVLKSTDGDDGYGLLKNWCVISFKIGAIREGAE